MSNVKSQCVSLAMLMGLLMLISYAQDTNALPPPMCNEDKISQNAYAQKLCAALSQISDFSRAMEQYLDAKLIRNSMAVNEPEVKRQDLDHVFLRFGRTHQ